MQCIRNDGQRLCGFWDTDKKRCSKNILVQENIECVLRSFLLWKDQDLSVLKSKEEKQGSSRHEPEINPFYSPNSRPLNE